MRGWKGIGALPGDRRETPGEAGRGGKRRGEKRKQGNVNQSQMRRFSVVWKCWMKKEMRKIGVE